MNNKEFKRPTYVPETKVELRYFERIQVLTQERGVLEKRINELIFENEVLKKEENKEAHIRTKFDNAFEEERNSKNKALKAKSELQSEITQLKELLKEKLARKVRAERWSALERISGQLSPKEEFRQIIEKIKIQYPYGSSSNDTGTVDSETPPVILARQDR